MNKVEKKGLFFQKTDYVSNCYLFNNQIIIAISKSFKMDKKEFLLYFFRESNTIIKKNTIFDTDMK